MTTLPSPQVRTKIYVDLRPSLGVSPSRDDYLLCPNAKWIAQFGAYLFSGGMRPKWAKERFDCDDFAFHAVTVASLCRAKTTGDSGNSVFIAYVTLRKEFLGVTAQKHALLLILDDQQQWWFVEPQSGLSVQATNNIYDEETNPGGAVSVDYVIM